MCSSRWGPRRFAVEPMPHGRGSRTASLLAVLALVLCAGRAVAEPAFPWVSLRAIAEERPVGDTGFCNSQDNDTQIVATLIQTHRHDGFYRMWAMLRGPKRVAIHYDGEGRPAWVWRGTWSGDDLSVASGSGYDPGAHSSACEILFGSLR